MIRTEINKIDNRQTTENQWEKKLVLWVGGGEIKKFDKPLERLAKKRRCNLSTSGKKRKYCHRTCIHQQDKGIPWTALHRYIWKLTWNGPIPWKAQIITTHSTWNNFISSITIKKIKLIVQKLLKVRSPSPNGFTRELYQTT